jgi:hypothetical protein
LHSNNFMDVIADIKGLLSRLGTDVP